MPRIIKVQNKKVGKNWFMGVAFDVSELQITDNKCYVKLDKVLENTGWSVLQDVLRQLPVCSDYGMGGSKYIYTRDNCLLDGFEIYHDKHFGYYFIGARNTYKTIFHEIRVK